MIITCRANGCANRWEARFWPGSLCAPCSLKRLEELKEKKAKKATRKSPQHEQFAAILDMYELTLVDFPKMLPTLLQLCHPDKHGGNSVAANKATEWLLRTRGVLSDRITTSRCRR
jgi:hypothetical protein